MTDNITRTLTELLADACGPDRLVDPADARAAGVPSRFIETLRRRSLRVVTPEQVREVAEELAELIADRECETSSTDPAELANSVQRR